MPRAKKSSPNIKKKKKPEEELLPASKANNKKTKKTKKTKLVSNDDSAEKLKESILALGGNPEQDLKLLQEEEEGDEEEVIEEEQEQEEVSSKDGKKELEAFMKKLGLLGDQRNKNQNMQIIPDQDQEEDYSEEEGEEDKEEKEVGKGKKKKNDLQVQEISSSTPDPDSASPSSPSSSSSSTSSSSDEEEEEEEETIISPAKQDSSDSPGFHFIKDKTYLHRPHCVFKVEGSDPWHSMVPLPPTGTTTTLERTPDYWLTKIQSYADAVLDKEIENAKALKISKGKGKGRNDDGDSERQWLETVLKSGALGDKISAYSVLLQRNPVHNLSHLETLIGMVSLKSRRPCMMALDALKEVFVGEGSLLAPDRKLASFGEQPFGTLQGLSGGNKDTRDKYLILWLFESKLKDLYAKFLGALDEVAKDTIEKTKIKTMSIVLELLIQNPEQEQELLSRLVNKLGDPVRSIAAKAMYQLGKLLEEHPAMKMVVLKEVERILYRPNVNPKAQYYGICFLSQILLDEDESNLANKLIKIYFGFFKACVKKGDIDSKLMTALLTGVNRAYPYSKIGADKMDEQVQIMFRVVNLSSFNTSVQALMLIYQIMDSGESATDRFYSALYKKCLDPSFGTSTKQALFLNLLFKSLKKDDSLDRVKAFLKRLLQICSFLPPNLACGCLFLMSEVIKTRPQLGSLRQVLLQTSISGDREAVEAKLAKFEDSDDEDEHYADVKEEEEDKDSEEEEDDEDPEIQISMEDNDEKPAVATAASSWIHKRNFSARGTRPTKPTATDSSLSQPAKPDQQPLINKFALGSYDPLARNPMYCGAEGTLLWELSQLSKHYHPSVGLFAQNLIDGIPIKYSGDPLQDFTLMRFLDRFVFRNPKKDPLKGKPQTVLGKRNVYIPQGVKSMAPDSKEYTARDVENVPTDERFIYRYFQEKRKNDAEDQDSDADSVTSEDFNALLDKMSGAKGGEEDMDLDIVGGIGDLKALNSDDDDDDMEDDDDGIDSDEAPEAAAGSDSEEEPEPDLDDNDSDDSTQWDDIKDIGRSDEDEEEEDNAFDEEAWEVSDNNEEEDTAELKKKQKTKNTKKKSNRKNANAINEFDESDDEDDDLEGMDFNPGASTKLKLAAKKYSGAGGNLHGLLASAEEFADLIDENVGNDEMDLGGSEAVSNVKDKAGIKQLKWEKKKNEKSGKEWKKFKSGSNRNKKTFGGKKGGGNRK